MEKIAVQTSQHDEWVDITSEVQRALSRLEVRDGACVIFTPHTTAALTINENADPDVRRDFLLGLAAMVPEDLDYRHYEENSPSHIKSSLVGCSVTVLIEDGNLCLGRWQGIYFCEFDGPRSREVWVKALPGR